MKTTSGKEETAPIVYDSLMRLCKKKFVSLLGGSTFVMLLYLFVNHSNSTFITSNVQLPVVLATQNVTYRKLTEPSSTSKVSVATYSSKELPTDKKMGWPPEFETFRMQSSLSVRSQLKVIRFMNAWKNIGELQES